MKRIAEPYLEALIELVDPYGMVLSVFAYSIGVILGGNRSLGGSVLEGGIVVVCVYAVAGILENLALVKGDRVNRPARPIASGIVSNQSAFLWAAVFSAVALAVGYSGNDKLIWMTALGLISVFVRTFLLNGRILLAGEIGGAVIGSALIPAGAAMGGDWRMGLVPFFLGAVYLSSVNILGTVVFPGRDRVSGRVTLASRIGRYRTVSIAIYVMLAVVPLSFIPYFFRMYYGGYLKLVFFEDVILVFVMLSINRDMSAGHVIKMLRILKIAVVPGLLAFLF